MRKKREKQRPLSPQWPDHQLAQELKLISRILDDNPQTLELIVQDLSDKVDSSVGALGLTAEQVLRCAVIKQLHQFSYRKLEFHLVDSQSCQRFCRLPLIQILKLRVAVRMRRPFARLLEPSQAVVQLSPQDLTDGLGTDLPSLPLEFGADLPPAFGGPFQRPHRIAPRRRIDDRLDRFHQPRLPLHGRLASPARSPLPAHSLLPRSFRCAWITSYFFRITFCFSARTFR